MHRGTVFIITKNEKKEFEVQKSTEFNGGMGLDCHGKVIYEMLKDLKEPLLFDAMIRDFDDRYFKYFDDVMTYIADEQDNPYISEDGKKYFEYVKNGNQFKFFDDDNGNYIYTSDSNYIKNMTNEDVKIACCNGCYKLKPNQILLTDYDECINNTKESFGKNIDRELVIDILETEQYFPTKKENIILGNIIKTIEKFGFNVNVLTENGMNNGIEIETWTDGGVDMIHTINFFENYNDLYDIEKVDKEIQTIFDNFSIDDEIDVYRQNDDYKNHFSIRESLEDFESYQNKLQELSNKFLDTYHKLIYEKFMDNEIEMEMSE